MNWFHSHDLARRASIARLVLWAVGAVFIVAFFRVQVLASSGYRSRSEKNRLRSVAIPAPRGLIADRNGVVLAENEPGYSLGLYAPSIDSLRATMKRMAPLLKLTAADAEEAERAYRRTPYQPVLLRRDAPFDLVSALEEERVVIPGLVVQAEPKRRYPFGAVAAHVVGYVAEISESELAARDISGARPGMLVGRDGLEKEYDDRLRGKDGERFVEVDALGRSVREAGAGQALDPEQGESIRTTIDINLQQFVAEGFPPGKRGSVIVMDPTNGDVLALYSSPTYDPNAFIGGVDPEVWGRLSQAMSGAYSRPSAPVSIHARGGADGSSSRHARARPALWRNRQRVPNIPAASSSVRAFQGFSMPSPTRTGAGPVIRRARRGTGADTAARSAGRQPRDPGCGRRGSCACRCTAE